MKRVVLFLATNIAILLVLSITARLLGVDRILDEQGVGLDLGGLLAFAALFGMGGSFLSLALSKWTAKRLTGAEVIAALEQMKRAHPQPLPDSMAAFGSRAAA